MNSKLHLFRGVRIPPSHMNTFRASVMSEGIAEPFEGGTIYEFQDNRHNLHLVDSPTLGTHITRAHVSSQWVCACGDEDGASFYSGRNSESSKYHAPLIIEFSIDPSNVLIDGRDFLYSAFQRVDKLDVEIKEILRQVFGEKVIAYIDRAASGSDDLKLALCDLACADQDIILSHYQNRYPIKARYGTRFCSAFLCKTPIPSADIIDTNITSTHPRYEDAKDVMNLMFRN